MPLTLFEGTGPTLTVEAALSAATGTYGAWDAGVWGTASWGPDELWTDISQWVRSVKVDRRFARDVQSWSGGQASIVLDNRDGRFAPANLGGPYVTAGVTGVRPWRPIRVRATYAGVTYDVYRGYAKDWQQAYLPGVGSAGGDAYVTVPCTDEYGALQKVDGLAGAPVGAGEASGLRVHRILNAAGHVGPRAIDTGNVTMQATDLSANTTANLELTTDSEAGSLYVSRNGAVTFERSTALVENARSNTIQSIWSDDGTNLRYAGVHEANDGDLMVNYAVFTRVAGAAQVATDETSRALYKPDKRYRRSDLICETDAQALILAQNHVQKYATAESRFTGLVVKPRRDGANLFPAVLAREVRDLIEVIRHPPGGYTVTHDCHIAGISHDISRTRWVTTFDLWSGEVYKGVGRWDVGVWDTSKWFF